MGYISIILLLSILCEVKADSTFFSMNHKLRNDLKDYDTMVLPHKDAKGLTQVRFQLSVNEVWIEDDTETLHLNAWTMMKWKDERFVYNQTNYGNISMVNLKSTEIWNPDILLFNGAKSYKFDHFLKAANAFVYPDGTVIWDPPAVFESNCPLDLTYWPFDTHHCTVILSSWSTHGSMINLSFWNNNDEMDKTFYHDNYTSNGWQIVNYSKKRNVFKYSKNKYVRLNYLYSLKRNSPTFGTVVVVLAIIIPLLMFIQFVVSFDNPKRLVIGCTCAILLVLELLVIKFFLPRIGSEIPLIVRYYSEMFVLTVVTIAVSVRLEKLSNPRGRFKDVPPPEGLKRILKRMATKFMFLAEDSNKVTLGNMVNDEESTTESSNSNYANEWMFIAKMIDRIFLHAVIDNHLSYLFNMFFSSCALDN